MKQKGAILVTLTYALPLAGIVLFVLLGIAHYVNTKITLDDAVTTGVRTAASRAKRGALWRESTPLLNSINKEENFERFFTHNTEDPDPMTTYTDLTEIWGGIDLEDNGFLSLPESYLLGVAFALNSIRESLGSNLVRYPCSLSDEGGSLNNSQFINTPGCLICYPRRHSTFFDHCNGGCTNCVDGVCPTFQAIPVSDLDRNYLSIVCRHNPSDIFTRPLIGLFRVIGTDFDQRLIHFSRFAININSGLLVD